MLLYEVMWGLPNAYLDYANAQRVVQKGVCQRPTGAAVGWLCPQPQLSPLLMPVPVAVSRCPHAAGQTLSLLCLESQKNNLVLLYSMAACYELTI